MTARDLARFTLDQSVKSFRGQIGVKEANTGFRGIGETRKLLETGMKIGYDRPVFGPAEEEAVPTQEELDFAEEKALTARLEELRDRRQGKVA